MGRDPFGCNHEIKSRPLRQIEREPSSVTLCVCADTVLYLSLNAWAQINRKQDFLVWFRASRVWLPLAGNMRALGTRLVAGVLFLLISIVQERAHLYIT